mgnify:CR=1 FL=1
MSDNNASDSSSTDNELSVLVAALGQTGNSRYVRDLDALADKAVKAINAVAGMNGRSVDNVVVRENYQLMQELESRFESDGPAVQYTGIDWRQVIDEGPGFDDAGEQISEGVMQDGDLPVAELMAEEDDDFDASLFDLNDRNHRNNFMNYDAIPQERINRAKAYARGKTDERCYNDYFENVPTVSAAIFLHDGTSRGLEAVSTARGQNPWVKYPSKLEGPAIEINCNESDDQIIDWARYLVETDVIEADELTEGQVADLQDRLSSDDLDRLEVAQPATPATPAEPVPSDSQPVTAD